MRQPAGQRQATADLTPTPWPVRCPGARIRQATGKKPDCRKQLTVGKQAAMLARLVLAGIAPPPARS
jgi:hypothetical protein